MATTHDHKDAQERKETIADFEEAVNMTASALERWLDSDDAKAV